MSQGGVIAPPLRISASILLLSHCACNLIMISTLLWPRQCLYVIVLCKVLLFFFHAGEKTTCHCTYGIDTSCRNSSSCEIDRGSGVCIAYYHHSSSILVQFCGDLLKKLICHANNGTYLNTRGICCYENYCNSQEALDQFHASLDPSIEPSTENSTTMSPVSTLPSRPSSSSASSPASSAGQANDPDSSPATYAIVLSIILPLMIIAVFSIAIVIFLMYIRLYIKHNKEKSSSEFSKM